MRVVATEGFNTYYEGVPLRVEQGDVLDGEIAGFLLAGGSAVSPVQEDAGPHPDTAEGAVPDGSAKDVLDWVDNDPDKAKSAAEAERVRDKPRSTLLADLDKIAGS
jgi:hypothetical protein